METKKEKAVIYARVSSKEQEKEGFSIPAQLKLLKEFAEKNNFEIIQEYSEAESAKKAGRKQFNEMLKFLRKNSSVKNILVEKTDRLYRNLSDYAKLSCEEYNIYLVKEGQKLTPESTCDDKFMHGINVLVAKRFIDNLVAETQKGRLEKIEEGYFIGQVPYGYKKLDKCTTVPDETKSLFVKRAFELYAKGDISLKNLRQKLYDEGYLYTPSSPKITTGYLEKMLKNECYTGMLRYNGKLFPGKHAEIVSKKLFYQAQTAFKKDNKPNTQKEHLFLYSGLLKCDVCGRSITCEHKGNNLIYYHCVGNYGKCQNKSIYIKEEKLDKQIDEAIKKIVIDDSLADYLNKILEKTYKELNIMTREKYEYLKREQGLVETRQKKLLDLHLDGEITKTVWTEKNMLYEKQKERLQNQINVCKSPDNKFLNEGKKILELAKHIHSLYSVQNIEEKQKMLKTIFWKLSLDGEKLHYTYNTPYSYFAEMTQNKRNYPGCDSNA